MSARDEADRWLATVDDVLGEDPDPCGQLPSRSRLQRESGAAAANAPMLWTAEPHQVAGPRAGAEPARSVIDETHRWPPAPIMWGLPGQLALSERLARPLANYALGPDGTVRALTNPEPMPGQPDVPRLPLPDDPWYGSELVDVVAVDGLGDWYARVPSLYQVDPVDLVVAPPSGDPADPAAVGWIERHAGIELTAGQRAELTARAARRLELVAPATRGRARLGVDLSADYGATVVAAWESDGGHVTVLPLFAVPVDCDRVARLVADTEGLDGWAARDLARRRLLAWARDLLWRHARRLLSDEWRARVERFGEILREHVGPIMAAWVEGIRSAGRVFGKLGRLWSGPPRALPVRRVDRARQLRVDRAMRTVRRRRRRRERRGTCQF